MTNSSGVVDLAERLGRFTEHWSPKVVARVNDYEIKVVKVQGEFTWHSHEDTDELFLVVDGELTIQLRSTSAACGCSTASRCTRPAAARASG